MEGLNGVIFVAGDPLFPVHPGQPVGGAAQHRPLHGGGGAEPRRRPASACSAASCFRSPCRATSPAPALVFVKVFDDLATPLLLNVKDMLAPQAYLRITSIGIADPMGYVISVVLIVVVGRSRCGLSALALKRQGLRHRAARRRRAGAAHADGRCEIVAGLLRRDADPARWCWRRMSACCCCRSRRSGRSARCRTASPLAHYARVFGDSSVYIKNTLIYAVARRPASTS